MVQASLWSIPFFSGRFAFAADLVPEALHVHVAAVCCFQHVLGAGSSTCRKHAAQQVRRHWHAILQHPMPLEIKPDLKQDGMSKSRDLIQCGTRPSTPGQN